jgi:serine/threonine protein kinase
MYVKCLLQVATRSSHGLEADVWGLGCLLYTLLVGRPPFDTDGVKSTLTKVVMADYKVRILEFLILCYVIVIKFTVTHVRRFIFIAISI